MTEYMYQHRRPSSSKSIYSHLKTTKHLFEHRDFVILVKEHCEWFEQGVKALQLPKMKK